LKVSIINVAYNMPEYNKKLFETAMQDADKHDINFYLYLHSMHEETMEMCNWLYSNFPCHYFDHGNNRGLSRSWNDGMIEAFGFGADVVIIANDDISFSPGDIDKMVTRAYNNRDKYMVSTAGYHIGEKKQARSHGYSCFALNPIALEKIGCFDENIFPIYLEDCDHHYRATLLGLVEDNCPDTNVQHVGSSAINNDEMLSLQNLVTQRASGEYYVRKWGGLNGQETFKLPFNDNRFTLYIDPEDRHNPYPGYNRIDRNIVAI